MTNRHLGTGFSNIDISLKVIIYHRIFEIGFVSSVGGGQIFGIQMQVILYMSKVFGSILAKKFKLH